MDSVQVMMDEHRQILRVLDALDCFAAAVRDTPEDKLELGRFVTFIREYADERHHGKEEHVLFAAMTRNGFPPEQGPVGMMLLEHQQMRALVSALRGLAPDVPHDGLYALSGGEAVRHLFGVASSLDSLVLGEPQILGQVKDAYEVARGAGTVGVGQAAVCWTELARSFAAAGDLAAARSAADSANELAWRSGDPWVCDLAVSIASDLDAIGT